MLRNLWFRVAAGIACLVCFIGVLAAHGFSGSRNTSTPIVVEVNPPNPGPNAAVNVTVYLSSASTNGTDVVIGTTDPGSFTDLPTSVYVQPGDVSTTFTVHTSTAYTSWVVITATANGGSALYYQP